MKKKSPKIFITGASGQLARSFIEIYKGGNIHTADRKTLDVTSRNEVISKIQKIKPHIILHFASLTRGDESTKNPELAYKINVTGTENVVAAAKKSNSVIVFVSTNEVFNGDSKHPYQESDIPDPRTVIGKTKYEAEEIIRKNIKKHFIIRTSWLYSKWSENFIHVVLAKIRKDQKITLVSDEISSPTYSLDLASAISKLIKTKKYGTYHIANTGYASRLEFAKKAFEIYDIQNIEINSVKLDAFKRLSKPPLFTALSTEKIKKHGIHLSRWKSALRRFLKANNLYEK